MGSPVIQSIENLDLSQCSVEEWSTQIPKFTSIEDGYQNFELPQK
jgi:hypothetical protein